MDKRPTLADVARVAGVSVPTVSRVLTGTLPVGSDRTRRVRQAVKALDYRPNAAARALVSGRPSMVAAVAGNTSRYGYARTLEGIEEAARAAGFMVMISVVENGDAATVESAVDLMLGQAVGGAVVLDFDEPGRAVVSALPAHLPIAIAGASRARSSPFPRAYLADQLGAKDATNYLLSLGHRTVHHIALPSSGRRGGRTAGWAAALREAGIEPPEPLSSTWDAADAYALAKVLAADPDVTAVLAGNDEVAFAVLRAMAEQHRSVPDEVSVVGFDDQPIAALAWPALTTVAQDFAELGRTTFGLLLTLMSGERPTKTVRVPTSIVVRESTAPPPG